MENPFDRIIFFAYCMPYTCSHCIKLSKYCERLNICYQNERCVPLCTTEHLFPVDGCAGAATGSFIGGVLLTAAIAGVIALVVLCRAKRRGTTKHELVLSTVTVIIIFYNIQTVNWPT